ncbi:hypothetical protein ABZ807_19990 [Micromonospora sp. NPDC047548]|uniref:hypothetical protein n=1 Tax=Micromonospora sp. NPDC047548 TaxID=3155624 RepID=UPI0033F3C53D
MAYRKRFLGGTEPARLVAGRGGMVEVVRVGAAPGEVGRGTRTARTAARVWAA